METEIGSDNTKTVMGWDIGWGEAVAWAGRCEKEELSEKFFQRQFKINFFGKEEEQEKVFPENPFLPAHCYTEW